MSLLHRIALLRSVTFAVLSMSLVQAQTSAQTPAASDGATGNASGVVPSPNLAQLRLMIDRGRTADALKQLDTLAAQQPVPSGVNRLRGLAL